MQRQVLIMFFWLQIGSAASGSVAHIQFHVFVPWRNVVDCGLVWQCLFVAFVFMHQKAAKLTVTMLLNGPSHCKYVQRVCDILLKQEVARKGSQWVLTALQTDLRRPFSDLFSNKRK